MCNHYHQKLQQRKEIKEKHSVKNRYNVIEIDGLIEDTKSNEKKS